MYKAEETSTVFECIDAGGLFLISAKWALLHESHVAMTLELEENTLGDPVKIVHPTVSLYFLWTVALSKDWHSHVTVAT